MHEVLVNSLFKLAQQKVWLGELTVPHRVGIKHGFYNKAQHGGFYRFYEGRFFGFYVGFINLKVYHNSHNQLLPYSFSVLLVLV